MFFSFRTASILALTFALTVLSGGSFNSVAWADSANSNQAKPKSATFRAGAASPKHQALDQLRAWRERILENDRKSQNVQSGHINKLAKLSLKRDLSNLESLEIATLELESPLEEIAKLDLDRWELKAQRQIVDQLVFAVDTKWSGSDLKSFLETTLLELSVTDLADPGQGVWWRFLLQASVSLRESTEPGADPIRYLEGYMAESTVLEPRSALEIMKNKNYVGN
jgi:Zn ribbon nucleic-acid-binding protein